MTDEAPQAVVVRWVPFSVALPVESWTRSHGGRWVKARSPSRSMRRGHNQESALRWRADRERQIMRENVRDVEDRMVREQAGDFWATMGRPSSRLYSAAFDLGMARL